MSDNTTKFTADVLKSFERALKEFTVGAIVVAGFALSKELSKNMKELQKIVEVTLTFRRLGPTC